MELIVTIGIVATAILLVVGVFTYLFSASQKSVDLTAGTVVAESIMQDMVLKIMYDDKTKETWYNADVAGAYSNQTTIESGIRSYNRAQFSYKIYLTDCAGLDADGSNQPTGFVGSPMCVIAVAVTWWDQGGGVTGSARRGYGQLAVELTRFLLYSAGY